MEDPCACDMDGIVDGIDTGRAACKDHDGGGSMQCYVSMDCESASGSGTVLVPSSVTWIDIKWSTCDPSVDNLMQVYHCEPCPPNSYSDTEGSEICSAFSANWVVTNMVANWVVTNVVTVGEGASDCECAVGYYMGASECVACEMNRYNPSAGATSAGATSAGQCIECAEGQNSNEGESNCR